MSYRCEQSYRWNYDHPPHWNEERRQQLLTCSQRLSTLPAEARYAGIPVRSPVAIAAGPALNGRWCLDFAAEGFEVVTYKTVRSVSRDAYALPNLLPVQIDDRPALEAGPALATVTACHEMRGSWAVSFGMPSQPPDVWQADITWTREQLPDTHRLAVSVVGTVNAGATLDELARDYARCGRWAASSGADIVELNFSCPNVVSPDGQLYQVPRQARQVAETVADELARAGHGLPLLIKIGYQSDDQALAELVEALRGVVTGCVMTNSLPAKVVDATGRPLFDGNSRGICGQATLDAAARQVARFTRRRLDGDDRLRAIGVGGITNSADVDRFLEQGAEAVQVATAAMLDGGAARRLGLLGATA